MTDARREVLTQRIADAFTLQRTDDDATCRPLVDIDPLRPDDVLLDGGFDLLAVADYILEVERKYPAA